MGEVFTRETFKPDADMQKIKRQGAKEASNAWLGLNPTVSYAIALSLLVSTQAGFAKGKQAPPPPPNVIAANLANPAAADGTNQAAGAPQSQAAINFANHQIAMQLWRNDLASKHPKGSCASCHGADFFDLARIGSTDSDIKRRATTDGATEAEANALVAAVRAMRSQYKMPATNARTFRPFQPGGQQLLPDLKSDPTNVANIKRDIAFAENVAKLTPTLTGVTRIATIQQARQAREEMLDIARGTNLAKSNPQSVQLRDLPIGIAYPLWSSDKFHGTAEGSLNDWVADVGMIPKPGRKVEWEALQNAYLANPSNANFWAMYGAVDELLQVATPLSACTATKSPLACENIHVGMRHKFGSVLIGQQSLRIGVVGRRADGDFMQGAIAFSYLDQTPYLSVKNISNWGGHAMLPADPWNVGDKLGRGALSVQLNGNERLGEVTTALGLPAFVVGSIDADKIIKAEREDIRLPWMWLGFTMDASFGRSGPSNSTRVGEYLIESLEAAQMFNHNAFMTQMRLLALPYLPEASTDTDRQSATGVKRYVYAEKQDLINYSYFLAYGRNTLARGGIWNDDVKKGGSPVAQSLKDRSTQLWSAMVTNGMRTSLLSLLDELQNNPQNVSATWRAKTTTEIQTNGVNAWQKEMRETFAKYQPQYAAEDNALLLQVANAIMGR